MKILIFFHWKQNIFKHFCSNLEKFSKIHFDKKYYLLKKFNISENLLFFVRSFKKYCNDYKST